MVGTFWALVPPLIAIVLALLTKEVYSSLFVGIVMGGLFYAEFSPVDAMNHILDDGFTASLTSAGNVGILIFLVILGTLTSFPSASPLKLASPMVLPMCSRATTIAGGRMPTRTRTRFFS